MKILPHLFVLPLLAALNLFVPQAHAAPVIKVALESPLSEAYAELFVSVFQNYAEEKSEGRLKFSVYANRALGNVNTVFQGLQFGTIQMTVNTTSNLSTFSKALQVFDLPYLFPDMNSIVNTFNSPEGQAVLNTLESKNAMVLAAWPSCLRPLITSSPIRNLEDVQGMKVRTTPSKTHMGNIASLGMAPTPMAGSEILTGLQQGVVKGMDPDISSMYHEGFYEVAPYFFLSDHMASAWMLICSSRWLKSLPPEDQDIVRDAGKLYAEAMFKKSMEFNEQAIRELVENKGCRLTVPSPEEKARWIEKSRSAYEKLPEDQKAVALKLRSIAWGE